MFELDGENISLEQLQNYAQNNNMDVDSLIQSLPGLKEVQQDPIGPFALPEVKVSGTQEEDTFIERAVGKNIVTDFFGDLYRAGKQGIAQGATVDEAFEIYKKGENVSDKDLQRFIDINKKLESMGPSDEMKEYERIKNEAGGGVWGFMKGMIMTRGQVIPQVIVSSAASMATTFFDSDEARKVTAATTAAGYVTGAGAGAAAGTIGGPVGTAIGGFVGAKTGAIGGAIAGLTGSMETSLTLAELIKDKLGDKDFNKENVRSILENKEEFNDLKRKALARGATIGAIEGITVGLSRGVGSKLLAKGVSKGKIARQVTGIEMAGGAGGEALGQVAAGQEFDIAEVLMEGVAEGKGLINVADILAKKEYKINGEVRTKKEISDIINDPNAKAKDLNDIKFSVTGDTNFDNFVKEKQGDAYLETQIDESITNETDRKKLVELEKQRIIKENQVQKKGIEKVPNAPEQLATVQAEIDAIINKYEGAAAIGETKKAQEARATAADRVFETNLEFAKKHSAIYGLEVDDTMTPKQIAKYIKDNNIDPTGIESDGFIHKGKIIINKAVAKETGAVNVGNHELLHGILRKAVKEGKINKNLISDLKAKLGENNWSKVEQRVKDGNYTQEYMNENQDEYLTLLSDAIANNEITFNEGLFTPIKELLLPVFRAFGFKKINFETADSTYDFLKEYNKSIHKGALSSAIIKATGGKVDVEGAKMSKTSPRAQQFLDLEIDNKSLVDITESPQSSQEDKFGAVEAIIEKNWPIISKALKFDPTGNIPMQAVKEAVNEQMLGIFPQVTLPDGKKISRNKPLLSTYNKENEVTTFLDATLRNRQAEIFTRAKAIGGTEQMGVDISEAKDVKALEPAKIKPTKKARKLKDLSDINIENKEVISETIYNKVVNLVKQNPENLTEQLEVLIEKEFAKAIKKQMGKISKKKGDVIVSEEYKAYHALNYENHVKGLDVNTIKKNYNTLFDIKKVGREKDKKVNPETGKVTYPGKGVYNIETNKAKFTKFFIEGGYTTLLARQKKLAELIAKSFTKDAINKYKIENSNNINVVIAAEIDSFLNGLDKQKSENRSFDTAKFSRRKNMSDFNSLISEAIFGDIESAKYTAIAAQASPLIVEDAEKIIGKYNLDNERVTAGYKQRIKKLSIDPAFDKIKEKYFNRLTNKNHQESIDEMTDFTTDMAALMDPRFVLNMYEDMFGFQYRYADKNRNGKEAYNKVQDTAKKQKANNKFEETFGFDPETAKKFMYNSTIGIMNRINTVLKKAFPTAKEKFNTVFDKEGKNIEQANKQNPKVLEYIITKAIQAVNKNPNNMIGVLRWLESATNTVKGLRALTGLTHIDVIAESQEASTKHPDYKKAYQMALKSINKDKKTKKLKKEVKEALAKKAALKKLNPKGEHLIPSANLMEKLAEIIYKYSKLDMTNASVLSKFKSELKETTKDFNQALGNKNTFDIVDDAMGSQAEGDVRLITGLKGTGRSKRFYHVSGLMSAGYISRKITQSDRFKKLSDKADKATKLNNATKFSRSAKKESKGITVLDFDDTLATTKSLVKFTRPDGTTGTLNAEEYASTYEDLLDQGFTFDFSDFNKVVKGKLAPLFNKAMKLQSKFGPENMFVLTARPPAAQKAIFDFLKANGLNIPLKNITGLGNSTAEAKALWIADKVGEGYNDFYFADDALQNVQAVKNMLDQFDVKSKVQQAKVKFSKSMNKDFNNILEDVTGIESDKRFSAIKARKRGESKGKFRFFIPPSHEDFVGLLYNFMGKGKQGNAHRDFFEKALIRPLNRAYRELNAAKQSIANDYKSLNKQFENIKNKLTKKTPDGDFTYQDAIRVYLWDKHGYDIPGLSSTDQKNLVDLVKSDIELQTYAETLNIISKQDTYVNPTESWEAGDIRTDLDDATGRVGREIFFAEFNENADIIFSEENFNKIEAAYGAGVVSAIKDMLYRIKTGQNRPSGQNALVNKFLNYLNGSVAATMFFNIRSAVLQQMSLVNFINFADNNIIAAAKAFANQPQYWKDFAFLFNSDFMKQRRGGIMTDVNGAELAASVKGAKNPIQAAIKKLLQLGFLPTQIGDNIAIATGGATFLRNRINTYLKQGLSQKEAEAKAFVDFQVLAEATQQSARPDMVSQQQASPLGKIILAFQNVTSQFNRLGKKAFLDIKNRRITPGNQTQFQSDVSNLSRIAYYFAIQNLIFYSLQSALFMMMFDDDEDDEKFLKKKERAIQGSIDSVLRGSGVWGSAAATLKNMAIKWHEQRDKGWNKDESAVLMEALNVSPPLGIKARKIVNAEKTLNYNKKVIDEMETFDIDNPMWSAYTSYTEAITNVPLNRLYNKTLNVRESLNNQHDALERALMFSGWSKWNLGIEDEKIKKVKEKIKQKKTIKKKATKKKKQGFGKRQNQIPIY